MGNNLAVSLRLRNTNFANDKNDNLDFLGKYKAICETDLACESVPIGELIDGKNKGLKIL
jgi:hypothetical protein